jgi:hypothetical protein
MSVVGGPRFGIVQDGLVLNLDAGNTSSYPGSGTTWFDLTSNNNDGTLINGPTFDSANGGSIVFDGLNDYVSIPNSSTTLTYGNSDFSIFCWVYVSSFNQFSSIIGKADSTATRKEWSLQVSRQATFRPAFITTDNTSAWAVELNSPNTLSLNQWYNIGVSRVGSTFSLYINGSSVASVSNNITILSNTLNVEIGRLVNDSTYDFAGRISNILIYKNKGLSATEVLQNYNATKTRFGL